VLFRPEEIVLSSGASPVDYGVRRCYFHQLSSVNFNVDAVDTMGAGIIKGYTVLPVLAADQQQEVHRSRDPKALPSVQGHCMEGKSQSFGDLLVALGQGVVGGSPPVLD